MVAEVKVGTRAGRADTKTRRQGLPVERRHVAIQ